MAPRSRLCALLVAVALFGCGGTSTLPLDASAAPAVNASIRFLNLEGGCWTIAVTDAYYLPLNLPADFKRDGLPVRVEFRERDDYGSICMVGPVVEILSIQSR
jgi:hypothetical protein